MSNNTEDTGKATSHQIDDSTFNEWSGILKAGSLEFIQEYKR
ncbi:MAG: hypothetical protein ABGU97_03860 [Xylella fastidiosa subsp. multiplex]|nr:hypothetical protein [Xylella fastidiosa]